MSDSDAQQVTDQEAADIVADWVRLLVDLARWSERDARTWAQDRMTAMRDNPFLLHDTTSFSVLRLIVPDSVWKSSKRPGQLAARVDFILEDYRRSSADVPDRSALIFDTLQNINEAVENCSR